MRLKTSLLFFLVLVWILGDASTEGNTTEREPNDSDIYFNEATEHVNATSESPVDRGEPKLQAGEDPKRKEGNSHDETWNSWSMTRLLQYLMSYVYGQKEEGSQNTSSSKKTEKQQYTLSSFSKLREECSSEECHGDEEDHDPVDPNPDVAFDPKNEGKRHRKKDLSMSQERRQAREGTEKTPGTLEDKEIGGPGAKDGQDSSDGRFFSEPSHPSGGTSKPQSIGESTADKTSKSSSGEPTADKTSKPQSKGESTADKTRKPQSKGESTDDKTSEPQSGGGIVKGENSTNASKQAESKKMYDDNSRKNKNDFEERKSSGSFRTRDKTKQENDENRIDNDGPKTISKKFGSKAIRQKRSAERETAESESDDDSNYRIYENEELQSDEFSYSDEASEFEESQQYDYNLEYTHYQEEKYDEDYEEFLADSTYNENDSEEDSDDDEYDRHKYDETNYETSHAEYENLFTGQSNNDKIYPATRLNEPVVSSSQMPVNNSYKPQETFDTILEYLYKYSNNPLFVGIKSKNDTMIGAKK